MPNRVSLKWGLVISGQLSVGKSTLVKHLITQAQLRLVRSVVTRNLEPGEETEYVHSGADEFVQSCRERTIVLPFHFAGTWYGFRKDDWDEAIRSKGSGFVFNVRPYLGLIIASVLTDVRPVWLYVDEEERQRRLRARSAQRDLSDNIRGQLDKHDEMYSTIFLHKVSAADLNMALTELKQIAG